MNPKMLNELLVELFTSGGDLSVIVEILERAHSTGVLAGMFKGYELGHMSGHECAAGEPNNQHAATFESMAMAIIEAVPA